MIGEQAWVLFVLPWVAVFWLTMTWNDHHHEAQKSGAVVLQPQPYPDMSTAWNSHVTSYLRGDITLEHLEAFQLLERDIRR